MDAARFEQLVAAYGAAPRRWPQGERAAAEAFAKTDAGQRVLAEARTLDAALEEAKDEAPISLVLRRKVLASAPKPQAPPWRAVAALAACAVFGVALGVGGAQRMGDIRAADAALALMADTGEIY